MKKARFERAFFMPGIASGACPDDQIGGTAGVGSGKTIST